MLLVPALSFAPRSSVEKAALRSCTRRGSGRTSGLLSLWRESLFAQSPCCRKQSRRPGSPGGGVLRSARPDQLVLPVALDQVCVDRSGEARVVELEADELATALAGTSPTCADLDL